MFRSAVRDRNRRSAGRSRACVPADLSAEVLAKTEAEAKAGADGESVT